MALRSVYTDLDGTLLGPRGVLFRGPEGEFSMMQARALEACHRAGVEVVIMSGRREAQVMEDARLIGQSSYIYEAGCAFVIEGETTVLTGAAPADTTLHEQIEARGIPQLLFEHFDGRLEYHAPWHTGRIHSHLFRGEVDVEEANRLLEEEHGELRLLDNGKISTQVPGLEVAHAYHLVPKQVSKGNAVAAHMRARGYEPGECIGIGDSIEDLEAANTVGRFFVVANGPRYDPALRGALPAYENVTVTEGAMGDGFYEAIVSTLARRE